MMGRVIKLRMQTAAQRSVKADLEKTESFVTDSMENRLITDSISYLQAFIYVHFNWQYDWTSLWFNLVWSEWRTWESSHP